VAAVGEEVTPIDDVDAGYIQGRAQAVDDIEIINHQAVEEAARAVVRAAAEARTREFIMDGAGAVDAETGELLENLMHWPTGHFYIAERGGTFLNTTTGEVLSRDPREPDESRYEWVVSQFEYFHERWPSYPRVMAEHCETARSAITSGEMTGFNSVAITVGSDWAGRARDDFVDYFLAPYGNAVTNQQLLLTELSAAMYAYEAVLRQGRLDARHLANEAVNVLESINTYSGGDALTILRVIGIGVAVTSTLVTAGTTAALTFGLLTAGLTASQLGVELARKEISGETADEVVQQLVQRLADLRTAMDAEEDEIAEAVAVTADSVEALLGSSDPLELATLLPNEPNDDGITNITGGDVPGPDEFRPPE
jgi:hypothetical protein